MARAEPIAPGNVPASAYQGLVETSDQAIFFLDPAGRVASWNAGARKLLGYQDAEIVGRPLSAFYVQNEVVGMKPQYDMRIAATEGRHESEAWRMRKDGGMFWAHCSIASIKAPDGTLLGFTKVMRDLTASRHFEEALRESEERARLLIASVKDYAIFLLDPQGRIMSWNEGARRLKGYEAEEIIGAHFSRFYRQEDIDRDHPAYELDVALREGRYEEEGWRIRKDGTRFWANVTITSLRDSEGRHVGFAKVTRDLTARKLAEEELRSRAISYANLNRELDAFSHAVAHDIRAPVRAVEHLASVLLEEELPNLSEEGKGHLRAIQTTAKNMAQLVQDLLELSTASTREPDRKDVDVTKVASEVLEELMAREPGRSVDVRFAPHLRASADPSLLKIAFSNLLGNALKFTRDQKRAVIEVGVEETKEGPAFFVRDNGAGFESARAGELFQPFARLHAASDFEGTGIGLATVGRIVHRHGGKIWAEGEPGRGATFWFTLGGRPE